MPTHVGCILSVLMRLGSAVAVLLMFAAAPARAASMPGAYLGDLTWPEAEARLVAAPLVVLAFAPAAKEHGPHLPLNADAKVAEYLCARAVEALPVVIAPRSPTAGCPLFALSPAPRWPTPPYSSSTSTRSRVP